MIDLTKLLTDSPTKVYIQKDNKAAIFCRSCSRTTAFNASRFKKKNRNVKIKCLCGAVFKVSFVFIYTDDSKDICSHIANMLEANDQHKIVVKKKGAVKQQP